jgi:hypothetical protein
MTTDNRAADFLAEFRRHNPCRESYVYFRRRRFTSFGDAWARCDRGTWMLWAAREFGVEMDRKTLVAFACECAERALPLFARRYPHDRRPRTAIEGARTWAAGGREAPTVLTALVTEAAAVASIAVGAEAPEAAYAALAASSAAASATYAFFAPFGAIEAAATAAASVGHIPTAYPAPDWASPALDGPTSFGDSAKAWLAEQRWQAERLRELLTVRDRPSVGAVKAAAAGFHLW